MENLADFFGLSETFLQGASAKDAQIMSVNNFYCFAKKQEGRGWGKLCLKAKVVDGNQETQ